MAVSIIVLSRVHGATAGTRESALTWRLRSRAVANVIDVKPDDFAQPVDGSGLRTLAIVGAGVGVIEDCEGPISVKKRV